MNDNSLCNKLVAVIEEWMKENEISVNSQGKLFSPGRAAFEIEIMQTIFRHRNAGKIVNDVPIGKRAWRRAFKEVVRRHLDRI